MFFVGSVARNISQDYYNNNNLECISQWTRVNLNANRTDPCAGLCHGLQVPARPYPMPALGFNFDGAAGLFTVPGLS